MMRMLLVQVPTSHLGAGERVYPLGLSRLSRLVPQQFKVWGLDMNLLPDPWAGLKELLLTVKPQLVALSFRNLDPLAGHHKSYVSSLKTTACMVRRLAPEAMIWAGGPAFSLFPERLMREIPEIDCGLKGEGESAFAKLIGNPCDPKGVAGLIWRQGEDIHRNPPGRRPDIDTLPEPDVNIFHPADYMETNRYVAAMGIEAKRGCDLSCAYCVYPLLGGRRMRLRNPLHVVGEMEHFHKAFGMNWFHFTDAVVNRPALHFREICLEILRRKLKVNWTGFFREDDLTSDLLDLAVRAGLGAVYFSADALTDHGLNLLAKRLEKDDILRAARITAQNGVLTMCHFLVNLPGETPLHAVEARTMLDRLLEIYAASGNLGAVIFNTVRLYPGAPLTRRILKQGLLHPDIDLLYPFYYNPAASSVLLHEMEARCHAAGVFSRLNIETKTECLPT
jgi:putative variant cofactor biosynthesis B12-binding/radical SAM domain protein 1